MQDLSVSRGSNQKKWFRSDFKAGRADDILSTFTRLQVPQKQSKTFDVKYISAVEAREKAAKLLNLVQAIFFRE